MFDESVAHQYDAWFETPLGSFVDEVETALLLELLQVEPSQRVLEVGCGTGHFLAKLAGQVERLVGVDLSPQMVAVARARLEGAPVDVYEMDAAATAFDDAAFDRTFAMATLEFVSDPARVLAEMVRVTSPGGRVVVGAINRESPWGRLYREMGVQGDPVFAEARLPARAEIEAWHPAGLESIEGCLYLPPDAAPAELTADEEVSRAEAGAAPGFLIAAWRVT